MAVYKAGSDVEAYCSKCKLVLAHVIIAVNGSRIARVECKTCRGVHAYRKEAAGTRRPRGEKGAAARNSVGPSDYERVIKGKDLSRAQRYRVSMNYAEGDVLDHVSFGLGMVMRQLADGKIEVLFPAGLKILIHARSASA